MSTVKIYCDTGGYNKKLKELEIKYGVKIYMFPYENINKKIHNNGLPGSGITFKDFEKSPATVGDLRFCDFKDSEVIDSIIEIVGAKNKQDIWHLDSAYKNDCHIFLTADKDDIYNHKQLLEPLLKFKIFLNNENLEEIENYIKVCSLVPSSPEVESIPKTNKTNLAYKTEP